MNTHTHMHACMHIGELQLALRQILKDRKNDFAHLVCNNSLVHMQLLHIYTHCVLLSHHPHDSEWLRIWTSRVIETELDFYIWYRLYKLVIKTAHLAVGNMMVFVVKWRSEVSRILHGGLDVDMSGRYLNFGIGYNF